jgi:hypothetical protein
MLPDVSPSTPEGSDRRPPSRLAVIVTGALIGLAWGSLMWLALGRGSGLRGWVFLGLTMAMIGCGVAALFGAVAVRRRGERVAPRARGRARAGVSRRRAG